MEKTEKDYTWIALILLGTALFMGRIWDGVLLEDTARYASVSKCILTTGDWITMHETPADKYFNKPPLYFWLTAVLFKIFGTTVWAARFWSALSGIGAVLLIYDIVKIYKDKNTALLSAIILCCSNDFLRYTAVGRLDGPQAFFITLAVWGFVRSVMLRQSWFSVVPGIAAGLGFLLKGPVILSALLLIIGAAILTGKARVFINLKFLAGLLAGFVIAFPWHAEVGEANPMFWDRYFGHEMVGRLNSEWLEKKSRLVFVRVLFEHYLPWTPFAVFGIYKLVKELYTGKYDSSKKTGSTQKIWHDGGINCQESQKQRDREFNILFLLWLALFAFISFIPPRMYGRYLIPLFPILAPLSAVALIKIIKPELITRLGRHLAFLSLILIIVFSFAPIKRHKSDDDYKINTISEIIKQNTAPSEKLPLFLVEVHAPKAMLYFYTDRIPYFLNSLGEAENPSTGNYIVTSKGGMEQLRQKGFKALITAEKMVLAERKK
ncbi:MAG: ArnT family glycosyltransferase [Planctomycetota bacterium]|jgi:4-amino-4-deoxy-L-arabinose transferase-like glycosyltransferase